MKSEDYELKRRELIEVVLNGLKNRSELDNAELLIIKQEAIFLHKQGRKKACELVGAQPQYGDKEFEFWANQEPDIQKAKKLFEFLEGTVIEQECPVPTKSEILKEKLTEFGFLKLQSVKTLSLDGQDKLISAIVVGDVPYSIALLDYTGFINELFKVHNFTKYKIYKELSKWYRINERTIKGNILVLNENSTEDKTRYTSHKHKEEVKNFYKSLK